MKNGNFNKKSKQSNNNHKNQTCKNNNENKNKKPEIYKFDYFLRDDKNSQNNRDKNKIKKYLIPLLISIVENKNFNDENSILKKRFFRYYKK